MRSAAGNLDFVIRSNISHHSDSEGCENSFEFVTGEGEGGWASALSGRGKNCCAEGKIKEK